LAGRIPSRVSRELSDKAFVGQCRLIEMGFRQGGPAGFGLRRVLIDRSGQFKGELKRGEHKSLQIDRVILMPGPNCSTTSRPCTPNAAACRASSSTRLRRCPVQPPTSSALAA
jgi:hypothetical protein